MLVMGDLAASSWVGILGGSVNDLKTTFRDAIAVETQSFAQRSIRRPLKAKARTKSTD